MSIESILWLVFLPVIILFIYRQVKVYKADKKSVCFNCGVKLTPENMAYLIEPGAIAPTKTKVCQSCKSQLNRRQRRNYIIFIFGSFIVSIIATTIYALFNA